MQLANPLPVLVGIPFMAIICGLMAKRLAVVEETPLGIVKNLPLDGLRGILASSVFFHHAYITFTFFHTGVWAPLSSNFYAQLGPTAVTLFFFISGYLFWGKMLKDPANIRWNKLIPNRLRRIMPAYLAAVLLLFIIVAFTGRFVLQVSVSILLFHMTSWILGGFPYPGGPTLNGVEPVIVAGGVFWTLQQEWLFYFLLPLLAGFRSWRRLLICCVIVFFAGAMLPLVPLLQHTNALVSGFATILEAFAPMFVTGFAVGMFAAYQRPQRVDRILRSPWMTVPAILLVAGQLLFVPARYSWWEPLLLTPVFFMIVSGNSFCGVLTNRPMRCLGAISYSLYLFHGMLLHTLVTLINRVYPISQVTPGRYWLMMIPVACIVVVWSTLTYRFIEKPFIEGRSRNITTAETVAP
jgi:peptidoglycan/LPS O-acetylase OafA/YrhL